MGKGWDRAKQVRPEVSCLITSMRAVIQRISIHASCFVILGQTENFGPIVSETPRIWKTSASHSQILSRHYLDFCLKMTKRTRYTRVLNAYRLDWQVAMSSTEGLDATERTPFSAAAHLHQPRYSNHWTGTCRALWIGKRNWNQLRIRNPLTRESAVQVIIVAVIDILKHKTRPSVHFFMFLRSWYL